MEKQNDTQMIPLYQAESTLMHMGHSNHRMLVALISVCVTFIITITVFVIGYTIREKNWLDTISRMTPTMEASDGLHEQPDASSH